MSLSEFVLFVHIAAVIVWLGSGAAGQGFEPR